MNENWGRELLELFSMGQGNYTEKDVREASRAFTGWGIAAKIPRLPYGRFPGTSSTTPKITMRRKRRSWATRAISMVRTSSISSCSSRPVRPFIRRHLYNFFVADEPQVPSWKIESPQDPQAIGSPDEVLQRVQL